MTYQELLTDALNTDDIIIAHYVFYAARKGLVQLTDEHRDDFVYELDDNDIVIVQDMIKQDYLKMRMIRLFSVPLNDKEYAFYYAKQASDVSALHQKKFSTAPKKIIDAQRMSNRVLWFPDTLTYKSFIDIKREIIDYPTLVCVLEKG